MSLAVCTLLHHFPSPCSLLLTLLLSLRWTSPSFPESARGQLSQLARGCVSCSTPSAHLLILVFKSEAIHSFLMQLLSDDMRLVIKDCCLLNVHLLIFLVSLGVLLDFFGLYGLLRGFCNYRLKNVNHDNFTLGLYDLWISAARFLLNNSTSCFIQLDPETVSLQANLHLVSWACTVCSSVSFLLSLKPCGLTAAGPADVCTRTNKTVLLHVKWVAKCICAENSSCVCGCRVNLSSNRWAQPCKTLFKNFFYESINI